MTTKTLIERADMALADLSSNGGLLLPEQANTFIDYVLDAPTVLKQTRIVRMGSPEMKINRLGFGSRIMRAASQTGGAEDDGTNGRRLPKAQRSAPTTAQITLNSREMIAEVHLPYELLEDNIEGRSLEEHIMRLIAERAALDLEEFALWADTASSDAYLALQNGWMKRASVNVVDNGSTGVDSDLFSEALLAMPQQYLRTLPELRGFISMANTIRYRQKVAARQTQLGDSAVLGNAPLQAAGLQLEGAPMLNAQASGTQGLVTFPRNLIFGIRRDITVETDKDIRARQYIIVLTCRVGLQIDDPLATVKLINI